MCSLVAQAQMAHKELIRSQSEGSPARRSQASPTRRSSSPRKDEPEATDPVVHEMAQQQRRTLADQVAQATAVAAAQAAWQHQQYAHTHQQKAWAREQQQQMLLQQQHQLLQQQQQQHQQLLMTQHAEVPSPGTPAHWQRAEATPETPSYSMGQGAAATISAPQQGPLSGAQAHGGGSARQSLSPYALSFTSPEGAIDPVLRRSQQDGPSRPQPPDAPHLFRFPKFEIK